MLHVRDMRTDSCLGSLYQESVLMTNHYINRNNPGRPNRRTVRPIKMMVQIVKKKKTQRLQTPRQSWVGRLASLRPWPDLRQPDWAQVARPDGWIVPALAGFGRATRSDYTDKTGCNHCRWPDPGNHNWIWLRPPSPRLATVYFSKKKKMKSIVANGQIRLQVTGEAVERLGEVGLRIF